MSATRILHERGLHDGRPINSFCIDTEEWFHICGVPTKYQDPATWDDAPAHVVEDTRLLARMLADAGAKGTFLTVGWVCDKYPDLIRELAEAGHEIGCHTYYHRLVYSQSPAEFEDDIARCVETLREVSGQPVTAFRAPGFSMKRECFWAYEILRRHGLTVDVSIVPAQRDHGGVDGFTRDPFLLHTSEGEIRCLPVSVMKVGSRTIPFSGGGYLRLFPRWLIYRGYEQNHREGRPGMSYIHPREINPTQPRLKLPWKKGFKYYVNLSSTEGKLRDCLRRYRFTTIAEVIDAVKVWPEYRLEDGEIRPVGSGAVAEPVAA